MKTETFFIIVGLILGLIFILILVIHTGVLFKIGAPVEDTEEAKFNGEELLKRKWRVVALAAHPDDLEYWIAGTLGEMVQKGSEVIAVIVTTHQINGQIRKEEQRKAAQIIGYKEVVFLDLPDGNLVNNQDKLKEKINTIFKERKPEVVFTFDIEKEGPIYHHVDHETLGKISLEVAKIIKPDHIYFYHTGAPNTLVNVTDEIDKKIEARLAHESQNYQPFPLFRINFIDWQMRRMAKMYGRMIGVEYAEPLRKGW